MNQEDKLNILKDILLTDEREYVSSIQKKITILEEEIKNKDISEQVDPIVTKKLNNFVQEIPRTLGPTITKTLKAEIKNSQDAVVEALYPIMGKMIKKYIQNEIQLLSERINSQVDNAFSFKSLKRKIKAMFTKTKESDLILQEQIKPEIEQLMVIEKGSGLIISDYSRTRNIEEDMVAGMLTAIKSFAEDAFSKQDQSLQYIEYDNYHIHIQNFSAYYIAVVISGAFNIIFKNELEDRLLDFAQNIINKQDLEDQTSFTKKLKAYFDEDTF